MAEKKAKTARSTPKGNRSVNLGKIHDAKLYQLKKSTGLSYTALIRRGIDAIELEEARRSKEISTSP